MAAPKAPPSADPALGGSAAETAAKTIAEVRELLEEATPQDLAERASTVREKLQAALQGLDEAVGSEAASLGEKVNEGTKSLEREVEEVEGRIRNDPIGAVVLAAGVGFLFGLLIRRGH
jgi:ElaB/YqjD/DUF883 family membrane-anchored ribosome-binding protein